MIAVSPKYQQTSNVDWRHGYIPQTAESFGVAIMAAALLIALLRRVRGKRWWPRWRVAVSLVLAVGLAGSAVWQRAATRSAYAGGGRDYTVFSEAVAAGIADPAGTEDPVVCDFMIWGGDLTAQKAFFPALCRHRHQRPCAASMAQRSPARRNDGLPPGRGARRGQNV